MTAGNITHDVRLSLYIHDKCYVMLTFSLFIYKDSAKFLLHNLSGLLLLLKKV